MSNTKRITSPFHRWNNSFDDNQNDKELNKTLRKRAKHIDESESEIEEEDNKNVFESLKNFVNISKLLRFSGAMAVIASMSAFLMQDWSVGSDVNRFYLMLMQTLLLAAGGFGLSFLMKENKGGRVFFGLSLISITANFAILGALVFSQVQWFGSINEYPDFLTWTTSSLASVGVAGVSALIVMVPIAWFSYMVFSRNFAKHLLVLFVISNLLLLIPVRTSLMVGLIVLAAVMVPLWILRKRLFSETSLKTPEGMFAVATVFIPALIMLVRSFWLYQVDEILLVMLGAIVFLMMRIFSTPLDESSILKQILNWASIATAGFVAFNAGISSLAIIPINYEFSVMGVVFALLALDVAKRAGSLHSLFSAFAVFALLMTNFLVLLINGGAAAAVLLLVAGIAVVVIGQAERSRLTLISGLVATFIAFAHQMYNTLIHIDFTNWATLAVIGVSAIIFASLLERHGVVLKHKWERWSQFKTTKEV
ncbi:MAG: hypothetical protein GKR92_05005 [Gammaproteobacteria bacterium]|nr:MAG: hypothetical protein GKR92_05005 [Gammaproteobacteria bacterium]